MLFQCRYENTCTLCGPESCELNINCKLKPNWSRFTTFVSKVRRHSIWWTRVTFLSYQIIGFVKGAFNTLPPYQCRYAIKLALIKISVQPLLVFVIICDYFRCHWLQVSSRFHPRELFVSIAFYSATIWACCKWHLWRCYCFGVCTFMAVLLLRCVYIYGGAFASVCVHYVVLGKLCRFVSRHNVNTICIIYLVNNTLSLLTIPFLMCYN